ncbi:hypothetical protein OF83DRAFT_441360 [Amylostereum chailletii]|nr:hypothetical protein OF83DRAFT_441360 [Amylostereum chailletii]
MILPEARTRPPPAPRKCMAVLFGITSLPLALATDPNFSIPSGWRDPTSNLTRDNRAKLAGDAASAVLPYFNSTWGSFDGLDSGQDASIFAVLAKHDLFNNKTDYRDVVAINLQRYQNGYPGFYTTYNAPPIRTNSDSVYFGLVAFYCYRAYGDQYFLNIATSVWEQTTKYAVTEANAASRTHPLRNVTLKSECRNATTAGAVFYMSLTARRRTEAHPSPLNPSLPGCLGNCLALL